MSVYNHRPMGPPTPSRLMELLDAVKNEYDQLAQEVMVCKSQRDEYEHKSKNITQAELRVLMCKMLVNSQIQEMNMFQQNLMELERTQQMIKKQ